MGGPDELVSASLTHSVPPSISLWCQWHCVVPSWGNAQLSRSTSCLPVASNLQGMLLVCDPPPPPVFFIQDNLSDVLTDIQESCMGLLEDLKTLGDSELAQGKSL